MKATPSVYCASSPCLTMKYVVVLVVVVFIVLFVVPLEIGHERARLKAVDGIKKDTTSAES